MPTVALQNAYNMAGRTSWHGGPRTITASAEQGPSRLGSNRPKVRDGREQITKEKVWTFCRSISGQHILEEPRISAWLRTHVSLPGLGARCGEVNWRRKKRGEQRNAGRKAIPKQLGKEWRYAFRSLHAISRLGVFPN